MGEHAASGDRQVLGRRSRSEWRLRLLILVLCSLCLLPVAIVAIVFREFQGLLALVAVTGFWLFALGSAVGTGRAVAFDRVGIEVRTLLKTWRYRWTDISGVGWQFVPSRRFPPMKIVPAVKLTKSVDRRSGLARLVERITGGAGLLPDLDFDEMDALREAFAHHHAGTRDKGESAEAAAVMKMLLGRCADLGDIQEIVKVGTLASIDLADYQTTGSKVRESIQSGDWAVASGTRQGTAGSDWVFWYVVERTDGRGAVVAIVHYIELYSNDQASLVRTLTSYDLERCRPYVTDWIRLTDERTLGV